MNSESENNKPQTTTRDEAEKNPEEIIQDIAKTVEDASKEKQADVGNFAGTAATPSFVSNVDIIEEASAILDGEDIDINANMAEPSIIEHVSDDMTVSASSESSDKDMSALNPDGDADTADIVDGDLAGAPVAEQGAVMSAAVMTADVITADVITAEVLEDTDGLDTSEPLTESSPEDDQAPEKPNRRQKIMAAIPTVSVASIQKMSVPKVTMAQVSVDRIEEKAEGWIGKLPESLQPFARLARLDKPVGFLLLALPCWIGLAFARIGTGVQIWDIYWLALFTLGAFFMRSAGCVWNDINDQDIDAKVERTKDRPLPAGEIKPTQAVGFLGVLLFLAFVVWLTLPNNAKFMAAAAIPLVAAYPFMKRFTWWPQVWLGLTFSWGILVSSAIGGFSAGTVALYLAMVCWVIAYDTLYAMQDVEDDALVGVKSTARKFGDYATLGAMGFHGAAAILIGFAAYLQGAETIGFILLVLFAFHGAWQAWRVEQSEGGDALLAFKSNVQIGFVVFIGFFIAAVWETIYGGVVSLFSGG